MRDRRARRLVAFLAVAALLLSASAPSDAAEDVTAAELRRLADRAEHDPAAQRELSEVRRVDGRPVDIGTAFAGADEDERRARLRTLAGGSTAAGPPDAAAARAEARRVLEERRFKPAKAPRPLRGLLRRVGEWLEPITGPLDRAWARATDPWWGQAALAIAAFLAALLVATRVVRHRSAAAVRDARAPRRAREDDPRPLERRAEEAEQAGDFDAAVRLRFRAGLLRLDRAGAVQLRPSLTAGELTRRIPVEALRSLADTFEAVAYAGEHADAGDAEAARRDWPRVLQEATRT